MILKKMKKWLEEMAKRNEERMGNQRLDCCNLNTHNSYGKSGFKRKQINSKSH